MSADNKKFLSIVTPTYNRADLLLKCYSSLEKQTDYDFEWIVIDDGSYDHTKSIMGKLKKNAEFPIIYRYKENGGKHTALNLAFQYLASELTIILDSDDQLICTAVETIKRDWKQYQLYSNICGLSYLRGYDETSVIGDRFPSENLISNHIELRINKNIKGDKAELIRSDLCKNLVFPVFKGEKFLGEGYLFINLANEYETIYINKIIYICKYLEGGLSKSGRSMRIKNAKGGMLNSSLFFSNSFRLKIRIKKAILYIVYGKVLNMKIKEILQSNKHKALLTISLPLGIFVYWLWKLRYKEVE